VERGVLSCAASLKDHITALVYPGALASRQERARHEAFIRYRLLAMLAVLGLAPLFLAIYGVPNRWHVVAFCWLMLPLGAIVLVSRTGKLALAQAICILSLVATCLTIAAGSGSDAGPGALAWLVLAPFEGLASLDLALIGLGGAAAALAAAGLAAAGFGGWFGLASALTTSALCILPAIFTATAIACGAARRSQRHNHAEETRKRRYKVLAETLGDLVAFLDRTGGVDFVSANCEAMLGLAPRELQGRGFFEHIHVADRPAFLKAIADAALCEATIVVTLRLRAAQPAERSGSPVFLWIELRARRFVQEGLQNGVAAILRDVTQAKRHEEALESARSAAEEVSLSKDQFLANVSHELRTPLNAIIGFAEMLGNPELTPNDPAKQREYAEIIRQSGQHLLAVVNTILDMSKLQSGSFDIVPEAFEMPPLIDLCCDMVKLKASEGSVELVRAYPSRLEEIIGDKRACKQILINLISNAVKFTPARGRVTVSAEPEGNWLMIRVADTGIGIDAKHLARLGDPFFQAGASYDRAYEGTGLGLSVVRGLVGLHGGAIGIESEPGKGTCVSVRLPLDCRSSAVKPRRSATIDTIARRTRIDHLDDFSNAKMVKKSA